MQINLWHENVCILESQHLAYHGAVFVDENKVTLVFGGVQMQGLPVECASSVLGVSFPAAAILCSKYRAERESEY